MVCSVAMQRLKLNLQAAFRDPDVATVCQRLRDLREWRSFSLLHPMVRSMLLSFICNHICARMLAAMARPNG
jgi:hypothetical protein